MLQPTTMASGRVQVETDSGSLGTPLTITMQITPDADQLILDEVVPLSPEEGIPMVPASQGLLTFAVASPLPEWAVAIEVGGMEGEGGVLDPHAVLVSSPETGGQFVPAVDRPIIARGTGPQPAEGLTVLLQVRPSWEDAPGPREGVLRLVPVRPPGTSEPSSEFAPPARLVAPGTDEGLGTTSPEEIVAGSGGGVSIPVEMSVGSFSLVVASQSEFAIQGGPGPGRYVLEPDVEVLLASNEMQWALRLSGTPFVSENGEIPLERVEWTRLGADGEPGDWMAVGESDVLMSGYGERGVFMARFRLELDVTLGDRPGAYASQVLLVGSPG
jgi:hypothetical protein